MPKSTDEKLAFGRLGRRVIEADFSGGDLSTEGGVLLLRRMDARLGLRELVLDVDATHVPLHGAQERGFFHGYCDNHCHLRRPRVLRRLELWGVDYLLGLQKNTRLLQRTELAELALVEQYQARGTKQRCYGSFEYAANSWDRPRQVIARLEHGPQGADPRFIVTSLRGDGRHLYDKRHCGRGEAENRIKEAQLDLFGRRAGCRRFWANPLRLLLASSHPVRAVFASAAHVLAP